MNLIENAFIELTQQFTDNTLLVNKLWNEVNNAYSESNRYYHNLSHIANLLKVLEEVKQTVNDWNTVLFALFYHDIVYKPESKTNEEESAELAKHRLTQLAFPAGKLLKCITIILSTKTHCISGDNDIDLFTDADLSILGQTPDVYSEYAKQVRKEYSMFSDTIYNAGRQKVINHILSMQQIFKTTHFFNKFEQQAKENLLNELKLLQ